jgi:hypothetical protein
MFIAFRLINANIRVIPYLSSLHSAKTKENILELQPSNTRFYIPSERVYSNSNSVNIALTVSGNSDVGKYRFDAGTVDGGKIPKTYRTLFLAPN